MAAPTISFRFNDVATDTSTPSWVTIAGGEVITFTGSGSSNGNLKPIQRPDATGNAVRIADECWINKATDTIVQLYDAGGQEVVNMTTDIFTANPSNTNTFAIQADTNPETQAGEFEAWDNTSYNTATNETLSGTTNLGAHSQLRLAFTANDVVPTLSSAGTIPAGYLTQTAQTTTYQLQGNSRIQTAAGPLSAGNQNRFIMHLFIVDDSSAGADTVELTYRYFYT